MTESFQCPLFQLNNNISYCNNSIIYLRIDFVREKINIEQKKFWSKKKVILPFFICLYGALMRIAFTTCHIRDSSAPHVKCKPDAEFDVGAMCTECIFKNNVPTIMTSSAIEALYIFDPNE